MSDITPENTHALLEKLAEYVMNEVATKKELKQKADKVRQDVRENKAILNIIIENMDAQAKQLDIIRTEQAAKHAALLRHEKRITALEEKVK